MFSIKDCPYLAELSSFSKVGMKNNVYLNPEFLKDYFQTLSLIGYRLLFIIVRIINDTVPYNGVVKLNLKSVNEYALNGEKFNANSLSKGIKELTQTVKDADGNVTTNPVLLTRLDSGYFCVNPQFVCNEDMYEQAIRYADLSEKAN